MANIFRPIMSSISERLLSALGGSYTIERELIGGGMAQVFVGEDHDLGRKVVIKVLPPDLAASVSAERFRREILTVARLQHPHIVPILKAGEVDGIPYFVMPYVDGESRRETAPDSCAWCSRDARDSERRRSRSGVRARAKRRPPRHQARQHPSLVRIGDGHGLRRKDVPAGLERLIARCLAIDPADRPQTAAALVETLEDPQTISGSLLRSGPITVRRGSRAARHVVVGALALVGAVAVSAGIYTRTHPNTAAAESGVASAVPNLGVIAVLPFVNLGADSTNAYLATGVTNAVAGKLMKTRGLRVLAPGRPRSVKRRSDTTSTAWVEARLVLEGTVERVGNRLRVTARLSSTDDDVMQWADVYDRDINDIFAVEDEIADAIVASVSPMAGQHKADGQPG